MDDPLVESAAELFQYLQEQGLATITITGDGVWVSTARNKAAVKAAILNYYREHYGEDSEIFKMYRGLEVKKVA